MNSRAPLRQRRGCFQRVTATPTADAVGLLNSFANADERLEGFCPSVNRWVPWPKLGQFRDAAPTAGASSQEIVKRTSAVWP